MSPEIKYLIFYGVCTIVVLGMMVRTFSVGNNVGQLQVIRGKRRISIIGDSAIENFLGKDYKLSRKSRGAIGLASNDRVRILTEEEIGSALTPDEQRAVNLHVPEEARTKQRLCCVVVRPPHPLAAEFQELRRKTLSRIRYSRWRRKHSTDDKSSDQEVPIIVVP